MFEKLGENGWTWRWWTALRFTLGLYVAGHFALLIPWAGELFSGQGMLPDGAVSPILYAFPNVLAIADGPVMTTAVVVTGTLAGTALMWGKWPRVATVVAWYALACLLGRNPLILNPALPHIGWLLLFFAAVPGRWEDGEWKLPKELYAAGWLMMGLAMSWSAVTKLGSPSWIDGSALFWVWNNPLARDTVLREALVTAPSWPLKLATWGALILELAALPAALWPRLRPYVWWALLAMHLGLLMTVNFTDLTLGMLVVHAALFDPRWLRAYRPIQWAKTAAMTPPAITTASVAISNEKAGNIAAAMAQRISAPVRIHSP